MPPDLQLSFVAPHLLLEEELREARRKAALASPWNLAPGPGPGTWEEFKYIH